MSLDRAQLADAGRGFMAVFLEGLRKRDDRWRMLVAEESASAKSVTQQWMGPGGAVEEWIGPRPMEKFRGYSYTLENKKWANGIKVAVEDIEDDVLGHYRPAIMQAAENFELHRLKLAFQLISTGFAATLGTAYDGQFFFDNDHLDDEESAQTNTATAAFSSAALDTGIKEMGLITDSKGDYLSIMPTHLFAPLALRAQVLKVLGNAFILEDSSANDASVALENYNKGVVTPILVPWLDQYSSTAWYLADLSKAIKPLRYQLRKDVEWQALDRPDSDYVFENDEVRFGGRARYNLGYGFWQVIRGSTGAG